MIGQNYIYEKDEDNAYFSVVGDDLAVAVLSASQPLTGEQDAAFGSPSPKGGGPKIWLPAHRVGHSAW